MQARIFDLRLYIPHLLFADQRAKVSVRIKPIAHPQQLGFAHASVEECVIQSAMHVAALHRKTGLSGIHERPPDRAAGCDVHIGVIEHQHGIFPAKFQHYREQASCRGLRNALARGDASGKDQLVDFSVQQCRARGPVADDDLKNIVAERLLRAAGTPALEPSEK